MTNEEIKTLAEKNAYHIQTINSEMGQLRDAQKATQEEVTDIKIDVAIVRVNTKWLMRYHWIIVTASIGALITGIAGLIFK